MAVLSFLIEHFTYVATFVLLFISGVGVPMPEEPILLLGGFVSAEGFANIWVTLIVAILGVIAGDNAGFLIGRDHGEMFLKTVERRFHISKNRVDKELAFFKQHPLKAIFVMRFLPGLKIFGPALAGYTGVRWRTYQVVNLVAVLVYVPIMILLGWHFSSQFEYLVRDVRLLKRILTVVILVVLGVVIARRMLLRK